MTHIAVLQTIVASECTMRTYVENSHLVCNVKGPVRIVDFPLANARKMMI